MGIEISHGQISVSTYTHAVQVPSLLVCTGMGR